MIAHLPGFRRTARFLVAGGIAATMLLASAPSALADSAQLTVTDTAGHADPVAGVARVFAVSGTAAVDEYLYIKSRPVGGAGCAPTPSSDPGRGINGGHDFYSVRVTGTFSLQAAETWDAPGTYLFCIWLAPTSDTVTTPISQVISFRSPTGTISATVNPLIPRPGQQATVTVTGASEAPEYVYAKVRPAGGASCAPSWESDTGDSVISGIKVNGSFSEQGTTTQQEPGSYVLCLWLAASDTDTQPIAGPQPIPFSVVQPPPKVSSASALNCRTGRHVGSVRARFVSAVCLRYRFSVLPLAGQKLTVTFLTPSRRTYKRVPATWDQSDPTIIIGSLSSRGYKHRRGIWQAVLRINAKEINRMSFRVR